MKPRASAVVFAYHDVGVRCLATLLAQDIVVPLVVTHDDDAAENIWFASVAKLAAQHKIPTIAPEDPNAAAVVARIRALAPDFLFSFYYRKMLKPELLELGRRGALNMHGSLLPKYRGRAPVNWAVINGETETGATLHYMIAKPDAGDIVDQERVAISPDDTAVDVFHNVTAAAEIVLHRSVPSLVTGNAPRQPQDLERGSYYGGRRPEDGCIDWSLSAAQIHNLVRGVAPPYPGAFTMLDGHTLRILRTRLDPDRRSSQTPVLYVDSAECYAACADGGVLRILEMELAGAPFTAADLSARFGARAMPLKAIQQ